MGKAKQDIVEVLEDLLERTKAGEIAFLIAAAHTKDQYGVSYCVVGLAEDQKVFDSIDCLKAGFADKCAKEKPNVMLLKL